MKVFYVHVPKCGSTFVTTLLHYVCHTVPGIEGLLKDPVLEPAVFDRGGALAKQCRTAQSSAMRIRSGHDGAAPHDPVAVQNTVVVLRSPHARVASGFLHNMHTGGSCCFPIISPHFPYGANKAKGCDLIKLAFDPEPVLAYAACVRGLMTKQLSGLNLPDNSRSPISNSSRDATVLAAALHIVWHAVFVGLTEHWNATVSLPRNVRLRTF